MVMNPEHTGKVVRLFMRLYIQVVSLSLRTVI